jgi:hypothetical protein
MTEATEVDTVVIVLKSLSLLLGGTITFYAFKAARRTEQRQLHMLGIGFGLVTVGALLAGISDQLLTFDRTAALAIESGFTTVGFLSILYSLVMGDQV